MSPISPKATPKARVAKAKAEPKKAPKEGFGQDQKLYFLWLHLQLKDGNKPNHAAVAAKLNLNYKTAFARFTQIKKLMEQIEESMEPSVEEHKFDFKNDPVSKVFEDLDKIFSEASVLR